jgi:hypothetical protein
MFGNISKRLAFIYLPIFVKIWQLHNSMIQDECHAAEGFGE